MKFDVPDEFLKLIETLNEPTCTGTVATLMKWASANPQEAIKIVDEYYRLGRNAKSRFRLNVFSYDKNPVEAVKEAWKLQAKQHKQRKILSKALAEIRGQGHVITMPNGVQCRITKRNELYSSEFIVQNVKVIVTTSGSGIATYLNELKERGEFYSPCLEEVTIGNQTFMAYDKRVKKILDAIKKNVNPYVNAVIADEKP